MNSLARRPTSFRAPVPRRDWSLREWADGHQLSGPLGSSGAEQDELVASSSTEPLPECVHHSLGTTVLTGRNANEQRCHLCDSHHCHPLRAEMVDDGFVGRRESWPIDSTRCSVEDGRPPHSGDWHGRHAGTRKARARGEAAARRRLLAEPQAGCAIASAGARRPSAARRCSSACRRPFLTARPSVVQAPETATR